jgi:small GTP-binding protein domain
MYDPTKIINLAILAHVDAGKTTLTEQMLFRAGVIRAPGSVDDGTTQTDWLEIERRRGISVRAAVTSLTWHGYMLNIIDTPGHVDFAGEVERALGVIDCAVVVISAVEGIQSHTESIMRELIANKLPFIVFINKTDRAGADADRVTARLRNGYGDKLTFFTFNNTVSLTELAAEFDDAILDEYLSGIEINRGRAESALRNAVCGSYAIPVMTGSAKLGEGVTELLDAVTELLPTAERRLYDGLSAKIFKLEHDKIMGRVAHVRIYGGTLRSRDLVAVADDGTLFRGFGGFQSDDGKSEHRGGKITQIRKFSGARWVDVGEVGPGDIAALCGLSEVRTGDFLGSVAVSENYSLAHPYLSVKLEPESDDKLSALVAAADELCDEEPHMELKWEKSSRELTVSLTGKIQLETLEETFRTRFGLNVRISPPSVIYRETPAHAGEGFDAYTMPKPCWAVVRLGFEPLPRGTGVVYENRKISNDKLAYKYQSHIERSVYSCLAQGPHGWQVDDVKITLLDGEHHTIHTHPLDFFVATPMAFMSGLQNTGTVLLEPLLSVRITAPSDFLGKVIGDFTVMGGSFDNPVITTESFTIEGILPAAKTLDYPTRLASLTSGRAIFSPRFAGYRECLPGEGVDTPYRGVNPLDRARFILWARGAYTLGI